MGRLVELWMGAAASALTEDDPNNPPSYPLPRHHLLAWKLQ